MKKVIIFILTATLWAGFSFAQNAEPVSDYGFVFVTNVGSTLTWTNDNAYPFKFNSMVFNKSTINTATVDVVHTYKLYQEVGYKVETNILDFVKTNYYNQVTNIALTIVTNRLLTANDTGTKVYDLNDIQQSYIQLGDLVRWTFSAVTTNLLMFDTIR